MSLDNIKPMLEEYAELKVQGEAITARLKELDKVVRPVLADRGEVVVNGYSFSCTMTAGRKTLDKKALEASGVNLESFYKQGAPFTTLKMKIVETL